MGKKCLIQVRVRWWKGVGSTRTSLQSRVYLYRYDFCSRYFPCWMTQNKTQNNSKLSFSTPTQCKMAEHCVNFKLLCGFQVTTTLRNFKSFRIRIFYVHFQHRQRLLLECINAFLHVILDKSRFGLSLDIDKEMKKFGSTLTTHFFIIVQFVLIIRCWILSLDSEAPSSSLLLQLLKR